MTDVMPVPEICGGSRRRKASWRASKAHIVAAANLRKRLVAMITATHGAWQGPGMKMKHE